MAPHWTGLLIIAVLLLLLFGGRGKISSLMGDFAKGITAFRKGLKDEDADGKGDTDAAGSGGQLGDNAARPASERDTERSSGS